MTDPSVVTSHIAPHIDADGPAEKTSLPAMGTSEDRANGRPWRRAAFAALVVWVGSHLGYLAVNAFAWRVGRMPSPAAHDLLLAWYRWDTGHYVRIADHGYGVEEIDVAFFPLYPLLIKAATFVLPGSTQFAALVVANVACFGALMMIYRLAEDEFGRSVAERTVYFLIAFPTAFFMSAAYNTSLFLLLAVGSLYCMRRGNWWLAGLLGAFASATRSSGLLLVLPFLYEYLRQRGFQLRKIRLDILAGGTMFAGVAAFAAYCWIALGDPLAFSHIQARWGRTFHWPWESLYNAAVATFQAPSETEYFLTNVLDLAAVLGVLGLLVLCVIGPWKFRSDQRYLVVFGVAIVVFPLFAATTNDPRPIVSSVRYAMEVFPAFIVLAMIGANRHFERIYVLSAVALQAMCLAVFMHYDWIG